MTSSETDNSFRSPFLMNRDDTAVLIIDVQEKLVPHIPSDAQIVWNIGRLISGAQILNVKIRATEQYPKGLGKTLGGLAGKLGEIEIPSKTMFSCRECKALFSELSEAGVHNILLCGIETHVCVAQTAFDLLSQGFQVYLCVDAVGSRLAIDQETAIRRMENAGVVPTTTEAALFEWCERAGGDEFKQISKLVQQKMPVE